jgi:4-hydroxy-tetrahydrodipicolinate synthase
MAELRINEKTDGVFVISATPFHADGSIDSASTDRLTDYYMEQGVTGLTILGMMGEANKLSLEEMRSFIKAVMHRVDGRLPVVVGVTGAGLDILVELSRESMDLGAAGIMVAPVTGLNTDEKIFGYFSQVVEQLGQDVPLCYQDYPQATGVHVSVSCLDRMFAEWPSMVMLKHEDCPGLDKLSRMREISDNGGRRISILAANGGLYVPQELARGADGTMTGFGIPKMLVDVVHAFKSGDVDRAEDLFDAYLPLVRYEQQPGYGLAVRKEVLHRQGVISNPRTRAPGPSLKPRDHDELTRLMKRVERNLRELN